MGGAQGNVFDTNLSGKWPEIGIELQGGNAGIAIAVATAGGGGGGGYWGGGGGSGGGVAKGGGGGGSSYWDNPLVANVVFVGQNDIGALSTNIGGNGVILISY